MQLSVEYDNRGSDPSKCIGNNKVKCYDTEQLITVMNVYNNAVNEPTASFIGNNKINSLNVLNSFHHLMKQHDQIDQFQEILNKLTRCDITKCRTFQRMNGSDGTSIRCETADKVQIQILDKIHCYFMHYDVFGGRISKTDRKSKSLSCAVESLSNDDWLIDQEMIDMNKSLQTRRESLKNNDALYQQYLVRNKCRFNQLINDDTKPNDEYAEFDLGPKHEFSYEAKSPHCVGKKHNDLKEELLLNKAWQITKERYDYEYKKAEIHFDSNYRRKYYEKCCFQYILSVMFYCNFDHLQSEFSKTYRKGFVDTHKVFYHWGKNLKEMMKKFGTDFDDGEIKIFYHGINQNVSFPNFDFITYFHEGMKINFPFSTSSSKSVATLFAGDGMVFEFVPKDGTQHFATRWLSDFPNEFEYLFLNDSLEINNIWDLQVGHQYRCLLDALKIIEADIYDESDYVEEKCVEIELNDNAELVTNLIENIFNQQLCPQSKYANHFLSNYLNNVKEITITFDKMHKTKHSFWYTLFKQSGSEWLYISKYTKIFPNLNEIYITKEVKKPYLLYDKTDEIMHELLDYIKKMTDDCKFAVITFDSCDKEKVLKYAMELNQNRWEIEMECDDTYTRIFKKSMN